MNPTIIDLRSDTVTRPTPAMLDAMMRAQVGDDVYGEDPTVNQLEEKVAALLGKEAALYVPTGTMANQIAINLHCRPGESIITEEDSHCFLYEAGAAAAMSGVQFDLIPHVTGLCPESIHSRYRDGGLHNATSRLLVVENTHNRGGGKTKTSKMLAPVLKKAKDLGLATHCDGARLWNAAIAAEESEKTLAKDFDTVAVCFSKGLGAPVGSALCGTKAFIEQARKVRKRWGGGMRQAGYLAAAASYAIDHHRSRLIDDHRHAATFTGILRESIRDRSRIEIQEIPLPTNMVYFRTTAIPGDSFVAAMKERGVLMHHLGDNVFRAVFHLQVTTDGVNHAADVVIGLLNQ